MTNEKSSISYSQHRFESTKTNRQLDGLKLANQVPTFPSVVSTVNLPSNTPRLRENQVLNNYPPDSPCITRGIWDKLCRFSVVFVTIVFWAKTVFGDFIRFWRPVSERLTDLAVAIDRRERESVPIALLWINDRRILDEVLRDLQKKQNLSSGIRENC